MCESVCVWRLVVCAFLVKLAGQAGVRVCDVSVRVRVCACFNVVERERCLCELLV